MAINSLPAVGPEQIETIAAAELACSSELKLIIAKRIPIDDKIERTAQQAVRDSRFSGPRQSALKTLAGQIEPERGWRLRDEAERLFAIFYQLCVLFGGNFQGLLLEVRHTLHTLVVHRDKAARHCFRRSYLAMAYRAGRPR
jgi:hypothetical protein